MVILTHLLRAILFLRGISSQTLLRCTFRHEAGRQGNHDHRRQRKLLKLVVWVLNAEVRGNWPGRLRRRNCQATRSAVRTKE